MLARLWRQCPWNSNPKLLRWYGMVGCAERLQMHLSYTSAQDRPISKPRTFRTMSLGVISLIWPEPGIKGRIR